MKRARHVLQPRNNVNITVKLQKRTVKVTLVVVVVVVVIVVVSAGIVMMEVHLMFSERVV